jgi:hypothetical protein
MADPQILPLDQVMGSPVQPVGPKTFTLEEIMAPKPKAATVIPLESIFSTPEKEWEDLGFFKRRSEELKKSGTDLMSGMSAQSSVQAGYRAENLKKAFDALDSGVELTDARKGVDPTLWGRVEEYAKAPGPQRERVREKEFALPAAQHEETLRLEERAKGYKKNPYIADITTKYNAGDTEGAIDKFLEHPGSVFISLLSESAAGSAVSAVGGALGGPAGLGAGSALAERVTSATDALERKMAELGIDINNSKAVGEALKNPEIRKAIASDGALKAPIVGVMDALAGLPVGSMATRVVEGAVKKLGVGATTEVVAQAASGAAGEYLGEKAEGREPSALNVAAEAITELGSGFFEAPTKIPSLIQAIRAPSPDVGAPLSSTGVEEALRGDISTPTPPAPVVEEPVVTVRPPVEGVDKGAQQPTINVNNNPPAQTLDTLPEERKMVKGAEGVSKEAEALAQTAVVKRNVARRYEAEGKADAAQKMRAAAEADFIKAKDLGFQLRKTKEEVKAELKVRKEAETPAPTPTPPTGAVPEPGVNTPPVQVLPPTQQPRLLYNGYGRAEKGSVYNTTATPILGNGRYYAMTQEDAEEFGSDLKVKQDVGHKTLVIDSDDKWKALARRAGFKFPNPFGLDSAEIKKYTSALKNYVQSLGFDSIEISFDPKTVTDTDNQTGNPIKLLRNVFGVPQMVIYENAAPGREMDVPAKAPVKKDKPFFRMKSHTHDIAQILPGHDIDAQAAGTVEVYGEAVPGSVEGAKLKAFAQEITNRFLKGAKVIIDVSSTSLLAKSSANEKSRGLFYGDADGNLVIRIKPDVIAGDFRTVQVLAHEFGHAVAFWNFYNSSSAEQQMIYDEYQRFLTRAGKISPEQAMSESVNALTLSWVAEDADINARVLRGESIDANVKRLKGWFDFDEWMAEQFVRWATTDEKPFTFVEKYFKKVATQIKNMFRFFGLDVSKSVATETMTQWFRALQERNLNGVPSSTPFAVVHSQLVGAEKVAKALGENKGPEGPTLSPASFPFWTGRNRLGLSQQSVAGIDKYNWWVGKMWNLIQLADKNPHIQGLRNFVEAVRAWHISKMELVSRADTRIRQWRKLGKEMGTRLSSFLYDMDSMVYLQPGQNMRWPTTQEIVQLAQKHQLNQRAVDLYLLIKGDFLHVLDRVEQAWIQDATKAITDPVRLQREIRTIQSEMAAMRAKPYFPHERFGDWTVTERDANGKTVFFQQFANRQAAVRAAKSLDAQKPQGHDVSTGRLAKELYQFRGLPPQLMQRVASQLNLTAAQQRQLEDMILDLSPANSAAKRFKRRTNTPGYSMDAMRSYAAYFMAMGGHIARLEHNGTMQDAIRDVHTSARQMRGVFAADAVHKRMGIAEWMQRLFDYLNESKSEWQGMRSFAFLWYLGFNISSAAINLTQVPMVTYPYLAARFGDLGTGNELRKAYTEFRGLYLNKRAALPQELQQALEEAQKQGFVDESLASELASAANGGNLLAMLPGEKWQRALMGMANIGAVPFQLIEKLNRRVSFTAAFRLAQKSNNQQYLTELEAANPELMQTLLAQGWTQRNARAFLAGRDVVEKSQFEYAKWARPEFMRGKKAVLFTFFMFKQNMLWFLKNSPGAGRAWLMLLAGAGIMGLPGADDLEDLVKFAAFHLFGKDFSPERELREMIVTHLQQDPDLIMHGLGYETLGLTAVGDALGIPVPSVDISSRIGQGRIIPGLEAATSLRPQPFAERLGRTAEGVAGAAFGVPLNMLEALASNNPDIFKRMERTMPTAFRNLSAAYRWADEGKETDASGATKFEFDLTDSRARMDIMVKALGFTPTSVAKHQDLTGAQIEAGQYWVLRRQELFNQFAYAYRSKDREGIADVRQAIKEYNREAPDKSLKITMQDLKNSYTSRIKRNKRVEEGLGPRKMTQGISQDIKKLYPSTDN